MNKDWEDVEAELEKRRVDKLKARGLRLCSHCHDWAPPDDFVIAWVQTDGGTPPRLALTNCCTDCAEDSDETTEQD